MYEKKEEREKKNEELIQEIKRNIVYRRFKRETSNVEVPTFGRQIAGTPVYHSASCEWKPPT